MTRPFFDYIINGMKNVKTKGRMYICHTYYHVYIAAVKELVIRGSVQDYADIMLSTMSNNFENLKERLEKTGLFKNVYMFDEKEDVTSEEVMKYHKDRGNIILNLLQRIKYTKLLGQLQEEFIPVDLSEYKDVYVFCDSDPIGYYLNYKKIHYHAVEDGLNSGLLDDQARNANKGAFPLKCAMAKMGLIFIESGYSRYCIDYEVNDISVNHKPPKNIVEVPRKQLDEKLSDDDHKVLVDIFLNNPDRLVNALLGKNRADAIENNAKAKVNTKPNVMILTEPLCDLETRKKLFGDIVDDYKENYRVIIKPHPRDLLDYEKEFPEVLVIKDRFPMEVLGDIKGFEVDKIISVITQMDNTYFAKEIVYLGLDFLDKYEDPAIHRKTELL
ncbi:lipooligosaccharide sialyltransferase [Butyrivibrio sp. YAB3001]|uniref:lipooligosaccharide sialyltransferase n=1 Tax=Butyrivibrio sp. YAB3001 TaxID=1520812 RepID=UPI0008F673AE|nr:lipooligosaccharide sialyltransferase [Butyrivibrio sp. YAB3001]SFC17120.1 Glycosyltransferase family 52 [Butyrivibrio sp. YAB3001]